MKEIKLFHWIFKTGDREGVQTNPRPPSGSATAFEGELAKLRCGDFFFLKNYNMIMYDVNTDQYDH